MELPYILTKCECQEYIFVDHKECNHLGYFTQQELTHSDCVTVDKRLCHSREGSDFYNIIQTSPSSMA